MNDTELKNKNSYNHESMIFSLRKRMECKRNVVNLRKE